jgi:putative peptide zinc metalloprotease protein
MSAAVDAPAPARAPGLELLGAMQGSGYQDAPRTVRRADGQTIQVTPLLYQLLEVLDGERDLPALAEALGERCGKEVAPEDVQLLLEEKLAPLGLICEPDGSAPQAVPPPTPLLGLKAKVVISDPAVTRRITAPFAALFKPVVVVPVLLAFAATCFWVLFRHGLASGTRQAFDSPGLLLAVFALTVVSAGWHEFGHAAACRAAGATPGAMGAGLYLVWPAFYTDVDDAYRLDRWGRLKVDLGGLYFNAVVAVAIMGVWLATGLDALLLVVAAQLLQMLRQLAPIIRADGYHILSDLVGVPDLFQHIKPTLAGMLPTNWGKPQPLKPGARWIVRAWVLVVVPLLLWMAICAVLLLPRLIATAWLGLQQQQRALTAGFQDGDVLAVLATLLRMFALVLPVAAGVYLVTRVVRRSSRKLWGATEDRPIARSGLVALAAILLVALLLAWWPAGQYEPVSASERGTLDQAVRLSSLRTPPPAPEAVSTAGAADGRAGAASFRPIDGVTPQTGWALVPRDPDEATLLLVRAPDGSLRSILTDGQATEGEAAGVAFPFALPEAPGEGDNQALAVNTGDGTVVYDVSVALVWVEDGEVADNRNEAYALASCANCTTVAVAFQVVLVVGQSDVVTPINAAVAANGGCLSCQTLALAVQLVLTLNEAPTEEVQRQLEAAIGRLDGITDLQALYDGIQTVQREVVTILVENGLVDEEDVPPAIIDRAAGTSASTSTTTTVAGSGNGTDADDDTTSTTTRSTSPSTTTAGGSTSGSSTTTSSTSTTSTTVRSTTTTTTADQDGSGTASP